ncbi:MAG: DUF6503 family protein [Bacteroidota bacterium]
MKKTIFPLMLCVGFLYACSGGQTGGETAEQKEEPVAETTPVEEEPSEAKKLVMEMVAANGGVDKFNSLNDVEFEYTYTDLLGNLSDVSTERYIFDGEYSWAQYDVHDKFVMPGQEGSVIQGYNGNECWSTFAGAAVTDSATMKMTDFLRKTNYYWFTMMYKLLDPGLTYELQGKKTINDLEYDIVKVGFEGGVGDVQDTYVLYINPETKLVDQFLFTVLDFGIQDPLLMVVEYQDVDGVKVPSYRKYGPGSWEGDINPDGIWAAENHYKNVKFNNGFDKASFEKPA